MSPDGGRMVAVELQWPRGFICRQEIEIVIVNSTGVGGQAIYQKLGEEEDMRRLSESRERGCLTGRV